MEKPQSLAEFLGTAPTGATDERLHETRLEDISGDAEKFCKAVLDSYEFRQYIIHGLTLGSIPAAVMIRVMDMAGWQKPPERIEHTGKDGQPIETITEVRRIVVRPHVPEEEKSSYVTH